MKTSDLCKNLNESQFSEMLTNNWDALTLCTSDIQGVGMLSLNRARRDADLYLMHEYLMDPIFKQIPALLEFKKDKVEDINKNKLLNAPRTVPVPLTYKDKNGNEFGCK